MKRYTAAIQEITYCECGGASVCSQNLDGIVMFACFHQTPNLQSFVAIRFAKHFCHARYGSDANGGQQGSETPFDSKMAPGVMLSTCRSTPLATMNCSVNIKS